jgi:hypothetical protein
MFFNNCQEIIDGLNNRWHISESDGVDLQETLHAIFSFAYRQCLRFDNQITTDGKYFFTDWWPSDTRERFEDNQSQPETLAWLEELGWTKEAVSYRFNQFGFRCDDFSDFDQRQQGIVAVGCSYTHGVGLPEEDVFLAHIEKHFGIKTWNLGVPGFGPGPIVDFVLTHLLEYIEPTAIIFTIPPLGRHFDLRVAPPAERIDLLKRSNIDVQKDYRGNTIDIAGSVQSYAKDTMALKCFAQELGIPFVCSTANTLSEVSNPVMSKQIGYDRARDLMHFGRKHHRLWADKYIRELEPQL